jgi:hypothetical protein
VDTLQPRALKVNSVLAERRSKLDEPHVAPLNQWVRSLRSRLGPSSIVPWFDPADGGINARILWLLEAPGPRSTEQRGSGIISCDNNDGAAENTWRTRTEAGVDRRDVVHWNVIPYYIGNETKIRAWRLGDVANAGPLLAEPARSSPVRSPQAAASPTSKCPPPLQGYRSRPGARDRPATSSTQDVARSCPRTDARRLDILCGASSSVAAHGRAGTHASAMAAVRSTDTVSRRESPRLCL